MKVQSKKRVRIPPPVWESAIGAGLRCTQGPLPFSKEPSSLLYPSFFIFSMKVREVMVREVITVTPQTTYEEAARILYGNKISGAPVVDLRGQIVGIVSEKDLFRAMYPSYGEFFAEPHAFHSLEQREDEVRFLRFQPVERFMTSPAVVVAADDSILRAGGLLLAHGLHRLPVVERGKLTGIVTREDIFRAILQQRLFSFLQKAGRQRTTTSVRS